MRCGTLNLAAPPHDAVAEGSQRERFVEDIANGLHALAQPLSVLRSALEMLQLCSGAGPNAQHYLELSAVHIRKACETFASVQSLLTMELADANPSPHDLLEMLTPIIDVNRSKYQNAGVGMFGPMPGTCSTVFCDPVRTEEAVGAVLDAMLSVSIPGDVVEIAASGAGEYVELAVENSREPAKRLNSQNRLGLSLARANVVSQGGRYFEIESPFRVLIAFPLHDGFRHTGLTN